MAEAVPLNSTRSAVSRKARKAEAVPLSVRLPVPLPPTVTAASLPWTVSVGVAPAGPAPTDSSTVRTSSSPARALARRISPLTARTVMLAGRASEGSATAEDAPLEALTAIVALAAPPIAMVPLPLTRKLPPAR